VQVDLKNIDEKWFSDRLELVLSTKGAKKVFDVKLAEKFVQKVYGDDKKRALANSLVIREYPINVKRKNRANKTKFIDLVYLDLDKNDGVIIGIENKFLTQDSEHQIEDYKKTLQELYGKSFDVKILYLTLDGRDPINYKQDCKNDDSVVCLSWREDILELLLESAFSKMQSKERLSLEEMVESWKRKRTTKKEIDSKMVELIDILITIKELSLSQGACKSDKEEEVVSLVKEILSKLESKIHKDSLSFKYIGKYYKLSYKDENLFLPISINKDQINNMIKQFCIQISKKELIAEDEIEKILVTLDLSKIEDCQCSVIKYLKKQT